jgi:hypothetical protein
MKVKAAPGVRVPKEGAPRTYITDEQEVVVDDSHYYRKRVVEGDLIRTDLLEAAQTPAAAQDQHLDQHPAQEDAPAATSADVVPQ